MNSYILISTQIAGESAKITAETICSIAEVRVSQ